MSLFIIFVFILGLCLGSFANVLIYRIPRRISIFTPASFCPNCKKAIKWSDNIPVLSYFLLNRKCRYCQWQIPVQYPAVELLTGIIISVVFFKFNYNLQLSILYSIFLFCLIVISLIDLQHSIIPDILSIPLILIGILFSPFNSLLSSFSPYSFLPSHFSLHTLRFLTALTGAIFGFVIMLLIAIIGRKLFKKDALGIGDVKLVSAFGAFLGIQNLTIAVFIGSLAGTISALVLIYVLKKKSWGAYLPYGPFLSIGAILTVIFIF